MTVSKILAGSQVKHSNNPFTNKLKLIYSELTINKAYQYTVEGFYLPLTYKVEQAKKTSIYINPNNAKTLINLNLSALQLFMFIAFNLKSGQDVITINRKNFIKHTNTSKSTFIRAVKELIQKQIIQPVPTSEQDTFYINPAFLFNGSRLKKYPDKAKPYQKHTETTK